MSRAEVYHYSFWASGVNRFVSRMCAVDTIVRWMRRSYGGSAVLYWACLFFSAMVHPTDTACYWVPAELGDLPELIAVTTLVVELRGVVFAEFTDAVEGC